MLLYALTIFVSAFLLFQVQPVIAKLILPWFGGSASVWITCLLFFQVALLAGYAYGHWLVRKVRSKWQARVHVLLLTVSVLVLPIIPPDAWKPVGAEDPTLRILSLLAATLGLPYLLLAATSPLLQAWYAHVRPRAAPYRLFASSNAGSLLGLLSYPVLVEPFFSLRHQALAWSAAYICWGALLAFAAFVPPSDSPAEGTASGQAKAAGTSNWSTRLLWMLLPSCASTLLLAVTNHMTENVAAVPLLWILPLSLYLLSFILCFGNERWYSRNVFLRLLAVALAGMVWLLSPQLLNPRLTLLIPGFSLGLFVCCMVCHGELIRLKPDPSELTSFYLMVSLGGALGGVFVGVLAPRFFPGAFELPIGLVGCAVLILVVLHRDPHSIFYRARWRPAWLLLLALVAALTLNVGFSVREETAEARVMVRNFYGTLRVVDLKSPPIVLVQGEAQRTLQPESMQRKLMHGTIDHGRQFLGGADRRRQPTAYYGPESGVALALREAAERGPVRLGVIGLGAGTLAAYGKPGDQYTFYEINPLVIQLARTEFTFLSDSPAEVHIVQGDARLSLEREPPQGDDVLAVDAFSGDAIPVHLLTREAFSLYFRHLKPGGVAAVNISNRYVNLQPVVRRVAESLGKHSIVVVNRENERQAILSATWVLVSDRQAFFERDFVKQAGTPPRAITDLRVWTDDYSDLLRVLRVPFPLPLLR